MKGAVISKRRRINPIRGICPRRFAQIDTSSEMTTIDASTAPNPGGELRAHAQPPAREAITRLSETELAGVDARDKGRPLIFGEGKRSHFRPLRVPNQVLVVHLGNLDAGAARTPGAPDPFRRINIVHC